MGDWQLSSGSCLHPCQHIAWDVWMHHWMLCGGDDDLELWPVLYGNKVGNACVARPGVLDSLIDWLPMVGQSMTSCPLTLYRPMTSYGVMRLMFLYDQWPRTVSWVLTCLCVFPPEDSLVRTVHTCNSIHYTHRKLIMHILIEISTLMRQKLNVA